MTIHLAVLILLLFDVSLASPQTGFELTGKELTGKVEIIGENVTGVLHIKQTATVGVHIYGVLRGFEMIGKHGMHIHRLGDISHNCTKAGDHFDTHNRTHGGRNDPSGHDGDLGNIIADANRIANVNVRDKFLTLRGENAIIGHSIVVHAFNDDLGKGGNEKSKINGNSGYPIACGVILWND